MGSNYEAGRGARQEQVQPKVADKEREHGKVHESPIERVSGELREDLLSLVDAATPDDHKKKDEKIGSKHESEEKKPEKKPEKKAEAEEKPTRRKANGHGGTTVKKTPAKQPTQTVLPEYAPATQSVAVAPAPLPAPPTPPEPVLTPYEEIMKCHDEIRDIFIRELGELKIEHRSVLDSLQLRAWSDLANKEI